MNFLFAAQQAIHGYMRLPLSFAAQVNPFAYVLSELGEAFFKPHQKPAWGIDSVRSSDGHTREIKPRVIHDTTFCDLLHFKREKLILEQDAPRILVIAPMSGHYATLLRKHVSILLSHFDVTITDWRDPRLIPKTEGDFSLDDYVDFISICFKKMSYGGKFHCIAVCQPGPLALIATALAERNSSACPESLTLIAAPIDTSKNPTHVNKLAKEHPLEYFESQVTTVGPDYAGFGRKVYPEYLQLLGFMTPNIHKHLEAHTKSFVDRLCGNSAEIRNHREFYDEYNAVIPLLQPYHLETLSRVFQSHPLATNTWQHRGAHVSLHDIRKTKLLTIEGERDDICGRGQTDAAIALCVNLEDEHKRSVLIKNAGHYGAFQGKAFTKQGLPAIIEITSQ